ncbi:tripartite tricarboxylate transporter TctB family protein [Salipiger sp.]|uniref:tripartite tricarboxylate transporter TctB family protein n=1 Tax=Salipiger sp. TaxID=2078585 RepID=UPI003A96C129
MRTTALQDRIVAVILLVLVAGGFAVTFDFSAIALYPRLLLGAMALMAAAIGLRSFLPARPREAGLPDDAEGPDELPLIPARLTQPVTIAAMMVLYGLAIPLLGYFTATLVAVPVILLWMGVRGAFPVLVLTLGFAGFVYVLFRLQLGVPLPRGLLF